MESYFIICQASNWHIMILDVCSQLQTPVQLVATAGSSIRRRRAATMVGVVMRRQACTSTVVLLLLLVLVIPVMEERGISGGWRDELMTFVSCD